MDALTTPFLTGTATGAILFLAALGRKPTPAEMQAVETALTEGDPREEVFCDLLWALLNSKEFTFNR